MDVRGRFSIFRDKVFLNSCSKGALSEDVRHAYEAYLRDWADEGSPWELWVGKLEAVRHAFAALISAQAGEIAVSTSVSAGVSALASALDFSGPRNRIVTTAFDFPTTAQIWHAQGQRGARIVHVPAAGNHIPLEHFARAIDDRTLLVSLPHICYRNGARLDVKPIVELAHSRGALVLLDAYQSLGTMPLDVTDLEVDFLVGGALKYLLGSSGLAFLHVRQALIPHLNPTSTGWFGQADIFAMDIHAHAPSPDARRFESGTPPVPNLYAALAGIQLIQSLGLEVIEGHIRTLTDAVQRAALVRGFCLASPVDAARRGALITLRSRNVDLLVKGLDRDGIVTSGRGDNLRVSPHIYNTLEDVDRLMSALDKFRNLMA